jgi:hypothetical protein
MDYIKRICDAPGVAGETARLIKVADLKVSVDQADSDALRERYEQSLPLVQSALGTAVAYDRELVQPARLPLALLDPQVTREVGIVAGHLLDQALRVPAADECLDGVAQRSRRRGRIVDDGVCEH